jgi:glycerol-3-phosphate dehydrogenase
MLALLGEAKTPWDVLIIGGGATGLGIAVDAASRGFRTLLLEQHDFAKGTSSRSTKLIHGGLRYLKQGNFRLVRESLHERGLLARNAPHLVSPLAFVIPCYRAGEKAFYRFGLKAYDALSGKLRIGASQGLDPSMVAEHLPTIRTQGLRGGVLYWDGQFDDARLAIALARTAVDLGACVLNYFPVTALTKSSGRINGVVARDGELNREFTIPARTVINATGVFTDSIRAMDLRQELPSVAPSRGAHIVLDGSFLPGKSALMSPNTEDKRVLFAIPWHGHVVVGTTDTAVQEINLEPHPSRSEIEFLLHHAGLYLSRKPGPDDILSTFAGLRPLAQAASQRNTALLPRDHIITVSPSGMISVTGGKWTTYRHMAEETLDRAIQVAGLPVRACTTAGLPVHGSTLSPTAGNLRFASYGSDASLLLELEQADAQLKERLHPALPYFAVEVVWEVRNGMARTVEDILARRTRSLFLNARASIEAAPKVARLMADALQKNQEWEQRQVAAFTALAQHYLPSGLEAPHSPISSFQS